MKYKLIKNYPGSPKLGTVVEAPEDCQTLFIIKDGVCFTYDQGLLDRYPEYWEKVLPEEGLLVHNSGAIVYRTGKKSGYGFDSNKNYEILNSEDTVWNFNSSPQEWRKATEQEEEKFVKMLRKECERRGLFEDTKIEKHADGSSPFVPNFMEFAPVFALKVCYNRSGQIFYKGKFATPLKETTATPQVGKQYTHKKGNTYTVVGFTNDSGDREDKDFPATVVYVDQEGRHWSRPLSRWHGSFELKE